MEGAQMGFTGKQVIHPTQIPVVQEAFSPAQEKVEWASSLIQDFNKYQESGQVTNLSLSIISTVDGRISEPQLPENLGFQSACLWNFRKKYLKFLANDIIDIIAGLG